MTHPRPPLAIWRDVAQALALLTRLPVNTAHDRGAQAAWAWPLAGFTVGAIAIAVGAAAHWIGLPSGLVALLILGSQIVLTGALHEDGLADVADGFWGGFDRNRRLEIMKDSRIGSYGVIALGLSLLARFTALSTLLTFENGFLLILAASTLSRAPMAVLMSAMPNARGTGLSAHVGKPSQATATLAVILALLIGALLTGSALLASIIAISATTIAAAAIAKTKIGGQTGDVLGATQQLAEIAALAAFTTL